MRRCRIARKLSPSVVGGLLVLSLVLAGPGPARAEDWDDYDSRRAGHPVRILAYVLHPVGVVLDTLIAHPAWWLAQFEPIRTLVGREPPREDDERPLEDDPLDAD